MTSLFLSVLKKFGVGISTPKTPTMEYPPVDRRLLPRCQKEFHAGGRVASEVYRIPANMVSCSTYLFLLSPLISQHVVFPDHMKFFAPPLNHPFSPSFPFNPYRQSLYFPFSPPHSPFGGWLSTEVCGRIYGMLRRRGEWPVLVF